MGKIIRTEGVSKVFSQGRPDEIRAVKDVSIDILRGEITVLKGPSGSGKTSLLSLIGCMTRPTEGRITVNGKDVAKLPERFLTSVRRKTFGFVFQQFNLIRDLTVLENVMLPLYPTGLKTATAMQQAESVMRELGIGERKRARVRTLSGGEQQRVAIARALVSDPDVIIADEPTAHLDTKLSSELLGIFTSLREEGRTIIMATHDPLIYRGVFVDRLIEMRDGMIKRAVCKQS